METELSGRGYAFQSSTLWSDVLLLKDPQAQYAPRDT